MEIKIKGLNELLSNLKTTRNQVPFALSQAINDSALEVQKFEIEKQFPAKFTLRARGSPWWKPGTRFGLNIKPFATKKSLRATVGSQADWLKLQEEGGSKIASGHRLSIEHGAREGKTAVLRLPDKPRSLLKRAGDVIRGRKARKPGAGFIIKTKTGDAIFVRTGKGRHDLKLMYLLKRSARIPAILKFYETAKAIVDKGFAEHFAKRWKAAILSSKPSKPK